MQITRTSPLTGKSNTREIPITPEQLADWQANHPNVHIQNAFPGLSADDREFLLTGSTPEDWDVMFPRDDEDEDDA